MSTTLDPHDIIRDSNNAFKDLPSLFSRREEEINKEIGRDDLPNTERRKLQLNLSLTRFYLRISRKVLKGRYSINKNESPKTTEIHIEM